MGHRVPNAACRPDARPRQRTQERRQGVGGKPADSTPRNEVCFVSQFVTSPNRAAAAQPKAAHRNFFDTSALFVRNERNLGQAIRALRGVLFRTSARRQDDGTSCAFHPK